MTTRKDALRNRTKLLEAAREVFAERGLAATLDDIAERAGVGTGTAYRHFRNKHDLAAEVLVDATQQIVDDAMEALQITDPWLALVSFFEANATRQAADRGPVPGPRRSGPRRRQGPTLARHRQCGQ